MAGRLARQPEPFVAYLITLSSHHPFDNFPATRRELRLGAIEDTPLGNYLQAMRFFDTALGAFLAELEAHGLGERTLVAIWGDHASGLAWDHALAERIGGPATEDEARLRESVPFLVLSPNGDRPRGEPGPTCGQIDFAPTLLALLGIDPAAWPWMGRNLLGMPGMGPVVLRHGAWLGDRRLQRPGRCVDRATREPLPPEACRALEQAAAEQRQIGAAVLLHDLQGAMRARLAAPR